MEQAAAAPHAAANAQMTHQNVLCADLAPTASSPPAPSAAAGQRSQTHSLSDAQPGTNSKPSEAQPQASGHVSTSSSPPEGKGKNPKQRPDPHQHPGLTATAEDSQMQQQDHTSPATSKHEPHRLPAKDGADEACSSPTAQPHSKPEGEAASGPASPQVLVHPQGLVHGQQHAQASASPATGLQKAGNAQEAASASRINSSSDHPVADGQPRDQGGGQAAPNSTAHDRQAPLQGGASIPAAAAQPAAKLGVMSRYIPAMHGDGLHTRSIPHPWVAMHALSASHLVSVANMPNLAVQLMPASAACHLTTTFPPTTLSELSCAGRDADQAPSQPSHPAALSPNPPQASSPALSSGFAASAALPLPTLPSSNPTGGILIPPGPPQNAPKAPPGPILVQIAATTPTMSRHLPTSPLKPLVGASPMSATASQDAAAWPSGSLSQAIPGVIPGRQVLFSVLECTPCPVSIPSKQPSARASLALQLVALSGPAAACASGHSGHPTRLTGALVGPCRSCMALHTLARPCGPTCPFVS